MKKIRSYKGLSLLLALLFFANTLSFSIDFHICEGEIYSFSLFGEAEPCDMSGTEQSAVDHECCKKHIKSQQDHKSKIQNNGHYFEGDCCSNKHLSMESLDDYDRTEVNINSIDQYQVFCILYTYLFSTQESENVELILSPPPIPNRTGRELSILYQVFQI